jgi:hypothetical protein
MANYYEHIDLRSKGAWLVHHGQKSAGTIKWPAEFPALDAAEKPASLRSQLAANEQTRP